MYRFMKYALLSIVLGVLLCGCGSGGDSDEFRYDPGIPDKVYNLTATPGDGLVSLAWETPNASYVATSYNVYYVAANQSGVVSKANAKETSTNSQHVVDDLENGTTYHFMVTAQNRNGESAESGQVTATPTGRTQADLVGTWYFHTLVCGPSATWERGTISIDAAGKMTFTEFTDSVHYNPEDDTSTEAAAPADMSMTVLPDKSLLLSGADAWGEFHGNMASRKNMLAGTWTYSSDGSKAITIFQKKRATSNYSIKDVSGTGNQNPYYPELAGNGPTRFAYHILNSGDLLEWEYSNARIGQQAQFWDIAAYPGVSEQFPNGIADIKDICYWDYSTPYYKIAPKYEILWKVTAFGVASDGLIKEYDSLAEPATRKDGKQNVIFTGRMTDDKTVTVGVSTKKDVRTGTVHDQQYYLRVDQYNFYPTDQALPTYTVEDLAGDYQFQEVGASEDGGGNVTASWARGTIAMALPAADSDHCVASFPEYADSDSATANTETFSLYRYEDVGHDTHQWTTFANFVTPDTGDGASRYTDILATTWWNAMLWGTAANPIPMGTKYYNEHATISYNKDMLVMTRTDDHGYSIIIGLK